jgi:PAS domain S-box-containing protein
MNKTVDLKKESLFKTSFNNSAIGMALVSPDGKWLEVNKSICDIVGYSKEELLTKTFQDITHKDDLEKDLDYVKKMLDGSINTYQMEKRYLHKDGHIVWVLLNVSIIRDESKAPQFFISEVLDINKIKNVNKKLEEKVDELEKLNKLMVDRELKMIDLKKKLNPSP